MVTGGCMVTKQSVTDFCFSIDFCLRVQFLPGIQTMVCGTNPVIGIDSCILHAPCSIVLQRSVL